MPPLRGWLRAKPNAALMAERIGEENLVVFGNEVNGGGKLAGANVFAESPRQLFIPRDHGSKFSRPAPKARSE